MSQIQSEPPAPPVPEVTNASPIKEFINVNTVFIGIVIIMVLVGLALLFSAMITNNFKVMIATGVYCVICVMLVGIAIKIKNRG